MDKAQMLTERLVIRRFVKRDYKAMHSYLSLPEVVRFEPYDVFSLAEARREAKQRAKHPSFWALCLRETGELIGNLYFTQAGPEEYRTWELGYVVHPDFQGRGYAREGARRMLEYGFRQKRAHRIIARCDPLNVRSWHLLESLGMRRETHAIKTAWFKTDHRGAPIWHDTYQYAILDEEWFARTR